jgi:hypothetical protein
MLLASASAIALLVLAAAVAVVLISERRRVRGLRFRWVTVNLEAAATHLEAGDQLGGSER